MPKNKSTIAAAEPRRVPARIALATALVLALLAAISTLPAYAQPPAWDAADLEAFLDPIIAQGMAQNHIPGAALVVVKDGEILLSKGYGYADLENQIPVDPKTTVFQHMSVSKLFTATAIMQLVEQGLVDLDADVNTYLTGYKVSEAFGAPMTIAQLLTHSAGLDEGYGVLGTDVKTYDDLKSLNEYLLSTPPRRAWPPGERRNYSNAAYNILGRVVEEVSGQAFADAIEAQVLAPLGMARTGFGLPHPYQEDAASSYAWEGDGYAPRAAAIVHGTPAGMLAGPAEEMAAFIIAHLEGGAFQDTRILDEATVSQMHAPQFTYHPAIAGQAFGFIEGTSEGRPRSLSHEGWSPDRADSLLYLLPEENLGFYLVQNADDSHQMIYSVRDKLIERYYSRAAAPGSETDLTPPPNFDQRAKEYTGVYRFGEYWHTSVFKPLILEWKDYPRVTAPGDGTLEITFSPGQEPFKYVQTGPRLFGLVNYPEVGSRQIAFIEDEAGRVTGFSFATEVLYEKVPWHGRLWLHKALFVLFIAVFVAGMVGGSVALWRTRQQPMQAQPLQRHRLALALAAATGLLNVLALATVFVLWKLDSELQRALIVYHRNPPLAVGVVTALLLASVLSAVTLGLVVPVWRRRTWPAWGRWLYTVYAMMAVAFVPFLSYWNLLGFRW